MMVTYLCSSDVTPHSNFNVEGGGSTARRSQVKISPAGPVRAVSSEANNFVRSVFCSDLSWLCHYLRREVGKEQPQPKIEMSDEYRLCCWSHYSYSHTAVVVSLERI